jgi:hypothetical protein
MSEPELYRCPPLAARISVRTCEALRRRAQAGPQARRYRPDTPARLQAARRPLPCSGCPGVLALAEVAGSAAGVAPDSSTCRSDVSDGVATPKLHSGSRRRFGTDRLGT